MPRPNGVIGVTLAKELARLLIKAWSLRQRLLKKQRKS